MSVLHFCWVCISTALKGLIGFVLIILLLWAVVRMLRPGSKFPRPVIYGTKASRTSGRKN